MQFEVTLRHSQEHPLNLYLMNNVFSSLKSSFQFLQFISIVLLKEIRKSHL